MDAPLRLTNRNHCEIDLIDGVEWNGLGRVLDSHSEPKIDRVIVHTAGRNYSIIDIDQSNHRLSIGGSISRPASQN